VAANHRLLDHYSVISSLVCPNSSEISLSKVENQVQLHLQWNGSNEILIGDLLWRLFNTICLLSFSTFSFVLPIGLENGDSLLIDVSFALLLCVGLYGMLVIKLVYGEAVIIDNGQDDGMVDDSVPVYTFLVTLLSVFPAMLLTSILWYIEWRFHLLGSFAVALIPMFLSNAMFMFACGTPFIFKLLRLFPDAGFVDGFAVFWTGVGGICIISPLFIFEILLIYHMDKIRFVFVIVFILLCGCFCVFLDVQDAISPALRFLTTNGS
jgi:hypothetical protein